MKTKKARPRDDTPRTVQLSRELALAIAVGNAGSTFEQVAVYGAGENDLRPDGRFWWAAGKRGEPASVRPMIDQLVRFLAAHRDAPPEAVYRQACKLRGVTPEDWRALPLQTRLAFTTFATCLVPLLAECDALDKLAAELARVPLEPPDRGIFKRTGARRRDGRGRGIGRRVVLAPPAIKEAAE